MSYENLFEQFKNYYFNNYTYVGISGNGNFTRQMTMNTIVFILAICLMLSVYVPWERLLGIAQCCSALLSIMGVVLSIILFVCHSFRVRSKFNKNASAVILSDDSKNLSNLLEEYLKKNNDEVNTFIIDRLIFYCHQRIELWKQTAIIVLSSFIVVLSAIIGVFLGPLLIEYLGGKVDCPRLTMEQNIKYLGLSLLFLIGVSCLQYQFIRGRLGPIYQYQQFNNSLEELKNHLNEKEEDVKRKKLVKELLTQMENENLSKKGWLKKLVYNFLK
ncbi:hypothetical protein OHD16_10470 [Sphingobacterium sp. ML3W]|uniref:hypothetical protein n=1 Tax=Sphingobacterium sp. ML3W TaxID=1538644 RepID=UPI00249A83D3|nr:hypothetical protein [Sphingobacterium sp. ML3W]WFA80384.1 hypothetical protein OGI71_03615 [Sphingobacterium sp. ML3W]